MGKKLESGLPQEQNTTVLKKNDINMEFPYRQKKQ